MLKNIGKSLLPLKAKASCVQELITAAAMLSVWMAEGREESRAA